MCLPCHIGAASTSHLDTSDLIIEKSKYQLQRKLSQEDSPSLVKLVRAVSVSTENGRSWLPAFPRN